MKKKKEVINAVLSSFTHATLPHKLQPGNLFFDCSQNYSKFYCVVILVSFVQVPCLRVHGKWKPKGSSPLYAFP